MGADALSRIAAIGSFLRIPKLLDLHCNLAHPAITRMWNYVHRPSLPFSLEVSKTVDKTCEVCCVTKPRFVKFTNGKLISALKPFERLARNIMGPKLPSPGTGNCFLLTVTDEYSRFPFALPLRSINSTTVISCLRHVFSVFGYPFFIHTDREKHFRSNEFQQFCQENGIAQSQNLPYHPIGNGQCERRNGTTWKAVCCLLESRKLPAGHLKSVLCEALTAIRTLL